jgi:hypothetical protein
VQGLISTFRTPKGEISPRAETLPINLLGPTWAARIHPESHGDLEFAYLRRKTSDRWGGISAISAINAEAKCASPRTQRVGHTICQVRASSPVD